MTVTHLVTGALYAGEGEAVAYSRLFVRRPSDGDRLSGKSLTYGIKGNRVPISTRRNRDNPSPSVDRRYRPFLFDQVLALSFAIKQLIRELTMNHFSTLASDWQTYIISARRRRRLSFWSALMNVSLSRRVLLISE